MVGEPLMNCRFVPVEERVRFRMRSFSHGSTPDSSSRGFNFRKSFPLKTASTVQRSAPVRMSDLSARSPSKSCSAPMMIDLPAPVSPVTAMNFGPICHSSSSTSARFLIRSRVRTVGIGKLKVPGAGLFWVTYNSTWRIERLRVDSEGRAPCCLTSADLQQNLFASPCERGKKGADARPVRRTHPALRAHSAIARVL